MYQQSDRQNELFRKFLDGELNPDEEREVYQIIAEDEDKLEILRFDRVLQEMLCDELSPDSFSVPEGFSESVMQCIEGRESISASEEPAQQNRFIDFITNLIKPKNVEFRPVYALTGLVLVCLLLGFFLIQYQQAGVELYGTEYEPIRSVVEPEVSSEVEPDPRGWVQFAVFDLESTSFDVAGNFNNWQPIGLNSEMGVGEQVWTARIFLLNNEWEGQPYITGDFNKWAYPGVPLTREGADQYAVSLSLEPGAYEYNILLINEDDEKESWIDFTDDTHTVKDGFGGENGMLFVNKTEQDYEAE